MDQTASSAAIVAPFIWLGIFLAIAWVINKLARKPIVNGALVFIWVAVALTVWSAIMLFRPNGPVSAVDPYHAFGQIVGAYLLPIILALFLSRRFRRKHAPQASAVEPANS